MEIQHFSHEHPLILREDHRVYGGEGVRCAGCDLAVLRGPNYSCIECNYFLHKSCAEQPRNKTHPMHQKHPLTLLPYPPTDDNKCDACHGLVKTFAYNCSCCEFTIDLRCASLPLTIQYESHEHPFTLLPKSAIFCCDACGFRRESISYICTTCLLWVHPECAALPLSVNITKHRHPVYLTRYLPNFSFGKNNCIICTGKVNLDYWFYYCEGCDIIAHVGCASGRARLYAPSMTPLRSVTNFPKKNEHLTTKISLKDKRVETKLEHFSHQHRLNLCDVLPKDEKCNGCTRPILEYPYYSCHQCKFSLHVSCAKLPTKWQHPLHPEHQLTLLSKSPHLDGIFRCDACTNLCNGFTYSCDKCKFNLDVTCRSIATTLQHDGHEHPLFLGQETSSEQCSACGEDCVGFSYGCSYCNFKLDTNCATLPGKAKHRFHRHTLNLTFSSIKDDSDEHYCDACEEPRNPNYWVYYCVECDLSAHLSCMRGEYPYIKFGGTYKYDSHPHLLTLVQKTKDNPPTCNTCDYPCESLSFECTECKFNIHWMCKNSPKGALKEEGPELSVMYSLDKTVHMMMTHDAREICQKERRSTKLKHFTHDDHFLTLGYVQNKLQTCIACKLHLEGPCYQCRNATFISTRNVRSTSCSHHANHLQHPLKLNLFEWPQNQFNCSVCKKTGDSYGYQCKDCNFNLHMHCVSTTAKMHQMRHSKLSNEESFKTEPLVSEVERTLKGQMHQ